MERKDYIYIVLIKALTKLGKFSRMFNHYEYTHIAVCLDNKLEDFITFSRKKHYSPFDSGFMHEKVEHYAFGENNKVKVKIFAIPVDINDKLKIEKYIKKIENDKIVVYDNMQTSIKGLFACGDCTGGLYQISKAVYEGTKAGLAVLK